MEPTLLFCGIGISCWRIGIGSRSLMTSPPTAMRLQRSGWRVRLVDSECWIFCEMMDRAFHEFVDKSRVHFARFALIAFKRHGDRCFVSVFIAHLTVL